jgi:transposase, IS5 family
MLPANFTLQTSLFDLSNRFLAIDEFGDPLQRLDAAIDWEIFRADLERVDQKERRNAAGRKPTDRVLMFKVLVLQHLHNLSDERLQYQITDRLSFMRFLRLDLAGDVPDARTVWAFREQLKKLQLEEVLFKRFHETILAMGAQLKSGQIVDATFVPAPKQRNKREENALIKEGQTPAQWLEPEHKRKLAQKDVDARWTSKGLERHYGYKNHVNVDDATKMITQSKVTAASVHDSKVLLEVLHAPEVGGALLHADSAYRSAELDVAIGALGLDNQVHERAYRERPLTEAQQESNKVKSKTRARVEHVFGAMENEMGGIGVRTIGLARARVKIMLTNLVYNIKRVEVLIRQQVFEFKRVTTSGVNQMV